MSEARNTTLVISVNEGDHIIGPANAAVTIVNYGDYQCLDCHTRHREVEKLIDELLNSVRFVFRHFPLVKIHPRALRAAEAAEAAAVQGKFWEMHRRLYLRSDKLEDKDLRRHAHEIGLDLGRFDNEMANSVHAAPILKNYYESINTGITGVPTTFINGALYAMSGVELVAAVKALLVVPNTHQQ